MPKTSGLGARLFVGGYDISGDIQALDNISGPMDPLAVTDITQAGIERVGGLHDGRLEATSYFNPDSDRAHSVLSPLPTTATHVTYAHRGAYSQPAASIEALQVGYDGSRGDDGSLTYKTAAAGRAYGLEWGHLLTDGITTLTTQGPTAGQNDVAAATDFGLQAYVHLLAFTGTSITLTLQDSDDDAAADPYATIGTGAATTAMTAVGSQRLETPRDANVKEWVRVNATGTFTNAEFVVVVVRNLTETIFQA